MENIIVQEDAFELLRKIPDNYVNMVLTDIPYGEVNRKSNGLRNLDKNKADMINFSLTKLTQELIRVCSGSIYIFCGTMQTSFLCHKFRKAGLSTRLCIWNKTNPSPMNGKSIWLSSIECCVFAKKPNATFNEHCKGSVWSFPCGRGKQHPTEKPLNLFKYLINSSSKENDLILDPFIGSGTTAVACVELKRRYLGSELDLGYYEIAQRRIRSIPSPIF